MMIKKNQLPKWILNMVVIIHYDHQYHHHHQFFGNLLPNTTDTSSTSNVFNIVNKGHELTKEETKNLFEKEEMKAKAEAEAEATEAEMKAKAEAEAKLIAETLMKDKTEAKAKTDSKATEITKIFKQLIEGLKDETEEPKADISGNNIAIDLDDTTIIQIESEKKELLNKKIDKFYNTFKEALLFL